LRREIKAGERLKQFIINREPDKDNIVRLKDDDYHYLIRVRRLAAGEFFPALLPNGEEILVQILSIEHNKLIGKCIAPEVLTQKHRDTKIKKNEVLPPIILFQSIPKGDKMDLIIRQAAEGGITEIVPFISEFSLLKTNVIKKQKFSRWEKIIKEARQQSGSKIATTVHLPAFEKYYTLNEIMEYWQKQKAAGALGLLFHHQRGLEQKSLHSYLNIIPKTAVFAVGPEGGFSDVEVSFFLENGFKPFTIGDTILRTETAALYCAAAIRILLLERNLWELKQS
jgi:16S rRNA (uracil1498-N3)-methyltransferase